MTRFMRIIGSLLAALFATAVCAADTGVVTSVSCRFSGGVILRPDNSTKPVVDEPKKLQFLIPGTIVLDGNSTAWDAKAVKYVSEVSDMSGRAIMVSAGDGIRFIENAGLGNGFNVTVWVTGLGPTYDAIYVQSGEKRLPEFYDNATVRWGECTIS